MTASLLQGCHDSEQHRHDSDKHHSNDDRLAGAPPNCFVRGTRILTPCGYRHIEALNIGDEIVLLGEERRKIAWIGMSHRSISGTSPRSDLYRPICFLKGSLGEDLPIADLRVSRDHRLYQHGMLIRAFEFINESAIVVERQMEPVEIDYFHILTEGEHGVLWAEGVPCETLLFSPQTIRKFDNAETFESAAYLSTQHGDRPYAPVFACNDSGYRASIGSHLRIALAPWIDRRTHADKVQQILLEAKW